MKKEKVKYLHLKGILLSFKHATSEQENKDAYIVIIKTKFLFFSYTKTHLFNIPSLSVTTLEYFKRNINEQIDCTLKILSNDNAILLKLHNHRDIGQWIQSCKHFRTSKRNQRHGLHNK